MNRREPRGVSGRHLPVLAPAAALLLLASRAAAADPACRIRVVPIDAPAEWTSAVHDAEARLVGAVQESDCRGVLIEVFDGRANVILTTEDGRRAVRKLGAPGEVEPTIRALLVTIPEPAAPAGTPAPPAEVRPANPSPAPVAPPSAHVVLGASAGARLAGPGAYLSPTLGAFAAITLARWDVGILGQFEPTYESVADTSPASARIAGLGAGVSFGRREPVGADVALMEGVTLGAAVMHERSRTLHIENDRAEARVGAYVGAMLPRTSSTRVRAVLGVDLVPSRAGQEVSASEGLPPLPWWAVSLALGFESEGL